LKKLHEQLQAKMSEEREKPKIVASLGFLSIPWAWCAVNVRFAPHSLGRCRGRQGRCGPRRGRESRDDGCRDGGMAWDMEKMAALFGKTATWRGAGRGGEAAIIC
jgi:hypothetical protein